MSQELSQALTTWSWDPSVWIGVLLLVGLYLSAIGPLRSRFKDSKPPRRSQILWFLIGMLSALLALESPLDGISDTYLFSAHMIQHMLLTLVVPPLLLLGTPGWLLRPLLRHSFVMKIAQVLTKPIVAFGVFNFTFLVWHLPSLYEATLQNESIHILEHLLFMATGVVGWWPILSPLPEPPRLSYAGQILYIFLSVVPMMILSALLVFATTVLYPTYAAAPRIFGLTVLADQQLGGLVMWTLGGSVYLCALGLASSAWMGSKRAQGTQRMSLTSRKDI